MACDLFFFLDMTHFLEAQVLLFSASFQTESDQELHVEHVDSLEQEHLNTFIMIIPMRFYMTIFTAINSHERRENSVQRTSEG